MDPLAHTLAGATMAQTGLKRLTPLATATLVIAANLPDIDVVFQFMGHDESLYYRRGMTHGVLALILLPPILTGLILAYDHFIRRQFFPGTERVRGLPLLALSYLGILSHPALDWLNTYGVRLLMPFSGRWFYGDLLFIIDAWMWLLMAASVVFAYSSNWLSLGAWVILGGLTTGLVATHAAVPPPAKLVWLGGLLVIAGIRMRGISTERNQSVALGCLTAFFLYLAALGIGNRQATDLVIAEMALSNTPDGDANVQPTSDVQNIMSGPLPVNPLERHVIAVTDTHYHGFKVHLFGAQKIEPLFDPVPIDPLEPEVAEAARRNDSIKGFVNWMRFPYYTTERKEDGYVVTIRDLRYLRPDDAPGGGIGSAQVFVPFDQIPGDIEQDFGSKEDDLP